MPPLASLKSLVATPPSGADPPSPLPEEPTAKRPLFGKKHRRQKRRCTNAPFNSVSLLRHLSLACANPPFIPSNPHSICSNVSAPVHLFWTFPAASTLFLPTTVCFLQPRHRSWPKNSPLSRERQLPTLAHPTTNLFDDFVIFISPFHQLSKCRTLSPRAL